MLRAFFKDKGIGISKSPIPKFLSTGFYILSRWPWVQLVKVAVDEIRFDGFRPTRQNFTTEDAFFRATLPGFIGVGRWLVNLDNGLRQ